MFACCGTVGPRWDAIWICLGSADAIISAEGNRSLRGKKPKYIQIHNGHCLIKNNLACLYTQVQHGYSLIAVLQWGNVAKYLSTSRGSNWEGIACILGWPAPISWGFTAISWLRMSISCRCRSSDRKRIQFCCQCNELESDSVCSITVLEKNTGFSSSILVRVNKSHFFVNSSN